MKRHATTIVLVVLALALGVWLWVDRDRVTEGERKRRENSAFVVWRRDEVTRIAIRHDDETIVLERDRASNDKRGEGKEGRWRMTSPREERADPVAVERLLSTLELATIARKVAAGAAVGLEPSAPPRAAGAVTMGSLEVPFVLGAPSPQPEGSSYFRASDAAPIVVSKEVTTALLAPSDTYRDRAVVPYLATELARFEVRYGVTTIALERLDEHSFRVAGTGLLASRTAVARLWAALAEMRAEAFPKDADADRLTANPTVTLVLTPKDASKAPAELVLGEACPGHPSDVVVLRKKPARAAACAPKDVVVALQEKPDALVEKLPFTFGMDEIEELRLERAGGDPPAIELARKGTGFHQRAPVDRDLPPAEADAASELVTRIAQSEARAVTRGGGAFPSIGRAVVHSGEREQIIEVGALGADGRATLRRVLDDARLEVDAAMWRRFVPRATSLRPRTILEGDARRPSRVILRCGTDQELVDRGEGFRLVSPAGYETDGAIVPLVDALVRGHIDAWVADADDGSFGFTKDGCHVVLVFPDGNAPVTVWFGAEGEGGVYVRVDPRPGVLVAPRSLRDLAKSIYVSRGSLRTQAERIERVRVLAEGKPVTVADASTQRDTMAALFADRVVSLKKPEGAPDLVIEVTVAEGGPARRIACKSISKTERHCGLDGLNATFSVAESRLAPLLIAPDGGAR
ncbi:MAG: hypothetical protein JWP87_4119 [Labilithrix sp.]|nr:hypothetical protein [Labilithrix sp.]